MPRPKDPSAKIHDPAYQAARRREVRQRHHAQVSFRISDDMLARWHAAAEAAGLTLKGWIIRQVDQERAE